MSRSTIIGVGVSVLVHALLLLFAAFSSPPKRTTPPQLETIAVTFLEPVKPKPLPPPPPPPLVPKPAPSATGEGRKVVRRAPKPAVSETRRPAVVERRENTRPSTPAPSRENATRRNVPPVAAPRTTPTNKPAERVATQTPPRTEQPADGVGTKPAPDATRDGGGRVGREGTTERTGGDPNGRDGAPPGIPGTGNDPGRGTGGGVDLSGFAGRRLVSRPAPRNTAGVTVTLVAEICAAPDGSVRVNRWTRVGNPELQREAAATLARWRFAELPGNVPQERQCGTIRLRFVAS